MTLTLNSRWKHYPFYPIILLDSRLSFLRQSISRWPLAAILEMGRHVEIIWTCKQYLYDKLYFLHACMHYLWLKKIISLSVAILRQNYMPCDYMTGDGGQLGNWRPYWKNLNICIVFITSIEHLLCLEYKMCNQNNLFLPSAALLRQKIVFQYSLWQPSWKWQPYWHFAWPAFFSCKVTPVEYLCQIFCLYHNLNESSVICNYLLHNHHITFMKQFDARGHTLWMHACRKYHAWILEPSWHVLHWMDYILLFDGVIISYM